MSKRSNLPQYVKVTCLELNDDDRDCQDPSCFTKAQIIIAGHTRDFLLCNTHAALVMSSFELADFEYISKEEYERRYPSGESGMQNPIDKELRRSGS